MGGSTPPTSTLEKDGVAVSSSQANPTKWSLKKKLALVAVVALVVIGLAVGLGVGLTVGRKGSDDDNDNDNNDNNNNEPGGGQGRNTTWRPEVGAAWQIILTKGIDPKAALIPGVDIYDIDLFDNSQETFNSLHAAGKKIICYFSAGSYEDWRADKDQFQSDDLGKALDGWPGEKWLKLSSDNVRNIMKKRIKYASDKGCDAIDPDNVDGYQNDNGLGLTQEDSISYMKFLSSEARSYNMSIGLKNAGDIIEDVLPEVDFSVNEQCIQYSECETFAPFIKDKKPVFNIEYPEEEGDGAKIASVDQEICSEKGKAAGTEGFSIVIKNMDLDKKVEYCDGKTYQ